MESNEQAWIDLSLIPRPWHIEITGCEHPWAERPVVVHKTRLDELPADTPNWQRAEAYRLEITEGRPTISAESEPGLAAARRTLRQLTARETVPDLRIADRPAYEWRGLNVDIARHFFGPDELIRVMDIMADVGLNRLHLHLSDDQGWRIEIPGLPELTERSSHTSVGGGPGGYLTRAQMDELARAAEDRGIALIPEVDVPGHTTAALHALPGLNPRNTPDVYEGIEVGISTLTEALPETERFLAAVFEGLGRYGAAGIHIGGDECLLTPPDEFTRLVARAAHHVRKQGHPVIAWQEAAPVLEAGEYVQVWDERQDFAEVAEAAARGVGIIASPATRAYLDMKYTPDDPIGLTWAGTTSVREALEWDPKDLVAGVEPGAIHGVEACIFTETIETFDQLTYMLLPRLAAVAEVAWAGSGIGQWDSFSRRIAVTWRR
ncbi:family 20 glycosylhydrolase [Ancrocorticia sp.]|uniref:family 20 glycosylhydrolase n=1 Tax=Ancrocorticia sp. TaxID=2593684 RepID=UPI003F8E3098